MANLHFLKLFFFLDKNLGKNSCEIILKSELRLSFKIRIYGMKDTP